MTKTLDYKTHGTCSRMIHVEIEDGIVRDVKFTGGCNGNTQGIAKLVVGRKADEVVKLLRGTDCGGRVFRSRGRQRHPAANFRAGGR